MVANLENNVYNFTSAKYNICEWGIACQWDKKLECFLICKTCKWSKSLPMAQISKSVYIWKISLKFSIKAGATLFTNKLECLSLQACLALSLKCEEPTCQISCRIFVFWLRWNIIFKMMQLSSLQNKGVNLPKIVLRDEPCGLYYKIYYCHNLWIFVIS